MTALSDDILARLSAYADGELDDAEARQLEAEIDNDPALAAALEDLRSTVAALSSLGEEHAPDDFEMRVARRIRRRSRGRFFAEDAGRGQRQLTLLFIVIAVMVLAAIAMLAGPGRIAIEWDDAAPEGTAPDEPAPSPEPADEPSTPPGADQGAATPPAPAEVRPVAREVSLWAVVDVGDDAGPALAARFGADNVRQTGEGRWDITVPLAQRDAAVAALSELGATRRRIVTLDERPTSATITVYAHQPGDDDPFALAHAP